MVNALERRHETETPPSACMHYITIIITNVQESANYVVYKESGIFR